MTEFERGASTSYLEIGQKLLQKGINEIQTWIRS